MAITNLQSGTRIDEIEDGGRPVGRLLRRRGGRLRPDHARGGARRRRAGRPDQRLPAGRARLEDVPFDAGAGLIRFLARSDHLRALPSGRIRLELVAVAPSGERSLGEYFLDHTA